MNIPNKNFEIRYYISLLFENGKSSILLNIDTTKCGLVKQNFRSIGVSWLRQKYPINYLSSFNYTLYTYAKIYLSLIKYFSNSFGMLIVLR